MGWKRRDTAVVLAAFILPIISGVWSILAFDDVTFGNFSAVELDWTCWAFVGLILSSYKAYLLGEDQIILRRRYHTWKEWLTGLWGLSNSIGFVFAFAMWAFVGLVVGQIPSPPNPPTAGNNIPLAFLTGGSFILVEGIVLCIMTFGLLCRRRLAE